MRHIWRRLTLPLFLGLVFWTIRISGRWPLQAQENPAITVPRERSAVPNSGGANRSAAVFSINSNLVLIPVLVTDRNELAVTGLGREHFRVWDEKAEQNIAYFASDDLPVSAVFVLDCSGSMASKLANARAAVTAFLQTANPEDEFALVQFNDQAKVFENFTTRTENIQNSIVFTMAYGRTALLDAIVLALHQMRHATHARRAIFIISDGGDNASRYSLRETKKLVKETNAQIYSIGIMAAPPTRYRSPEEFEGPNLLDEISSQSGGRFIEVYGSDELPAVAAKIGLALRNQYVIGYAPSAEQSDGKYHRIRVKVAKPKGIPPLRLSFRTGYFAPAQ